MKKLLLNIAVTGFIVSSPVIGAVKEATIVSSKAIWQAEASKDSTSELVITPMRALQLKYVSSTRSFNQDTGTFEVTIRGDHSSSGGFKLEALVDDENNTLHQVGGNSTLSVGAYFGGRELGSTKGGTTGVSKDSNWTTLLDSATNTGISSGLWTLTQSSGSSELSAQDSFKFSVKKASTDGTTETTFDKLPDGMWQGEVAVAFRATWSE